MNKLILTEDLIEELLDNGPLGAECPDAADRASWGLGRKSGWDEAITYMWKLSQQPPRNA